MSWQLKLNDILRILILDEIAPIYIPLDSIHKSISYVKNYLR